ncbi:MAG TPA: hypothetical protein VMF30_05035 [Pirellulales bacterium]|nr:hypothetical protein [Pirellulales bacterium]
MQRATGPPDAVVRVSAAGMAAAAGTTAGGVIAMRRGLMALAPNGMMTTTNRMAIVKIGIEATTPSDPRVRAGDLQEARAASTAVHRGLVGAVVRVAAIATIVMDRRTRVVRTARGAILPAMAAKVIAISRTLGKAKRGLATVTTSMVDPGRVNTEKDITDT